MSAEPGKRGTCINIEDQDELAKNRDIQDKSMQGTPLETWKHSDCNQGTIPVISSDGRTWPMDWDRIQLLGIRSGCLAPTDDKAVTSVLSKPVWSVKC